MESSLNGSPVSTADTTPEAQSAATPETEPTPGIVSRGMYSCGYWLGYGVMYPSLVITRSLPLPEVVTRGFADGSRDAGEAADRAHQGLAAATDGAAQKAHEAYASVARTIQEKVESFQDSLAERRFKKAGADDAG